MNDFYGLGKDQLLVLTPSQDSPGLDCYYLSLSYKNGELYAKSPLKANLSNYTEGSRIFPMDYNGDGKVDLCCISSNGTTVYSLYDGLKTLAFISELTTSTFNSPHPRLVVGDVNGDGRADLLVSPGQSGWRTNSVRVPEYCCGEQDLSGRSLPAICKNCGEYVTKYVDGEESYYWDNGNVWTLYSSCGKESF